MKFHITLILFLLSFNLQAQKTEMLLLGTYHFGGNTSDNIKVTNDDILSTKKQSDLKILLDKLEKFNPEVIYVENEPNRQVYWDSIYANYKNGNPVELDNELFQIGIKLASRLNLKEGIKCVDWHIKPSKTFFEDEYASLYDKMEEYYLNNLKGKDELFSSYEENAIKDIQDFYKKIPNLDLIEAFRIINSNEYLNKMYYGNISSLLDIDENKINIFWSQNDMIRNVNIYQNIIQDILRQRHKRVLVIYGAGHIKALKDYFEVHPAVKITDTQKILK